MTVYKQQCVDWGNAIRSRVDAFYDPRIAAARDLIAEAIAKGLNPKDVEVAGGIAKIDYERLLADTQAAKAAALANADAQVRECDSGAVPDWLADAQAVADYAGTIAMLPYVALTQHYAAAHIDLGDIYKGRPLGGDGALIPKVRDGVLHALGIEGEQAAWLRDPVKRSAEILGNAAPGAGLPVIPFLPIPFPVPVPVPLPIPVPTPGEVVEQVKDFLRKPFG